MTRTLAPAPMIALWSCLAAAQPAASVPPRATHLARAETVRLSEAGPAGSVLSFVAAGQAFTIDLEPSTIRAAGARLVLADAAGQRESPWPPTATFRGAVRGLPGTLVAGAMVNGLWRLVIDRGAGGGLLFVQPWAELDATGALAAEGAYAAYSESDLIPGDWTCGVGGAHVLPTSPRPPYGSRVACNTLAQIAFDADFSFYTANGSSVPTTTADIESVLNATNLIYARDTNITHQISHMIIRTAEPDPYSTNDVGGVLDELAREWEQNQTGVIRDMAHLMVGERFSSGVIGVAFVGAVCTYGYGWSRSQFTPTLAYRVGLTAHELGHNWGSGHCNGDSDCYIMCGGIGGCSGSVTRFGSRAIGEIRAFVPTRACLDAADGYPTPLPPRPQNDEAATVGGSPIRIDVLANDFDGNCQTVSILDFPARTNCGHGSLSRSVGTGPGGRDELLYTPDSGYTGDDCFTYRARDPGGLSDSANVTIRVLAMRPADNPTLTKPGLAAAYYHPFPMELADLSLTTPYLSGTVATIDFPASSEPFAGSGRAVGVGAVFTGTLNIAAPGSYTFYTESDDGSALYVNGLLMVANDGPQGMFERSAVISLPAGPAQVRVEYFQGGGGRGLIARIAGPGIPRQVIPAAMWAAPGVRVDYYNLGDEVNDLPNLAALPVATRSTVAALNQATVDPFLFTSARRAHIAASFTGYFAAPADGLYRFFTTSDDASFLWIGGTEVVNNRGAHGMIERSGFAALRAGRHAFRADYWQGGGGAGLIVEVEGPGLVRAPIAAASFSHTPAGATDCNEDGVDDAQQAVDALDLGDILAGGDGRGTAPVGAGVIASTGVAVPATAFGASGTLNAPAYSPLNGVGGRPNRPRVEGVLVPHGLTTIGPSLIAAFPATGSGFWDALRNGGSVFEGGAVPPLLLADRPETRRPGIGIHTNGGVTFDLAEIRAAEAGRRVHRVRSVAGFVRDGCFGADSHAEAQVLIDGVVWFRRLIGTQATAAAAFDVPIPDSARYLTLVLLDADGTYCDHTAFADAALIVASGLDADGDGSLDACACPADFNRDGGVDGADVEAFYRAWQDADGSADVNHDGGVDGADVETFFRAWEQGGC